MTEQGASPTRQINILRQALSSDKNKVAFLLGAGCPLSVRTKEKEPLIQDIVGLTKIVCETLKGKGIERIKNRISVPKLKDPTIEDILSHVRLLIEVVGNDKINELNKIELENLERKICQSITKAVEKELPKQNTSYHHLAAWIGGIHRVNPIEIFTPNYDLLIESALESKNIPYFDGFIGSKKAFFDLHSIEQEKLPSRWVKLWKLHGSINWWNDQKGNVFRGHSETETNKQMIYPSHLKYNQSRRMPYLAMQDRLGHFLSSGQAVMITSGYSFADEHLNEILTSRLSANPRAICFALLYDTLDKYPIALECAKRVTNLSLISQDKTYIGGEEKTWMETTKDEHYKDYIEEKEIKESKDKIVKCNLGDFAKFGNFLINQIGSEEIERKQNSHD